MSRAQTKRATVIFTPSGKRGRFDVGTPLLDCARALGVDVDSVCGGRGICGRCRVRVGVGEFPKHAIVSDASHIVPITQAERQYDAQKGLGRGMRLACHARLAGDVVVDVPASSQLHRQIVRKRADMRDIAVDPAIRLHFVKVAEFDMESPSGDYERLLQALREQWGLAVRGIDHEVLCALQGVLRAGGRHLTVALWQGEQIIAIWPGFHERVYGAAIDVGSTTIAAHICNLASGEVLGSSGLMNPQIRFGEDLMSRISYAMLNEGGAQELTQVIRKEVNRLIEGAREEAGVESEDILSLSFAANPVMHHILLGLDPVPLGAAPFALGVSSGLDLRAQEIEVDSVNKGARIYVLPCIAGHVGADAAAMVLSEAPYLRDDISLLIDVGTNAEIVLGNKKRLLAASSPTGPAFEGAQISHGQRAAPGAVERVRIDRDTLEPRFKVIGCNLWSDEPGFAKSVADTGITGICGSGIIEAIGEMFLARILTSDGKIDGEMAQRTDRVIEQGRVYGFVLHRGEIPVIISQADVRAIQLAKAALHAGVRLLMDRLGVETVDRIVLAGAFGSYIDARYAMLLGMIPDCDPDRVSPAGNTAGTGARIALLNRQARLEIEKVVKGIEKIEIAVEADFQEYFVRAMAIPNETESHTCLRKVFELPPAVAKPPASHRRRGQRDAGST